MKMKYALFFKLIGSLFALALLAAPSLAVALTITQVLVVVGGAQYCDTTGPNGCTNFVWDLGVGGVTLNTTQTLILTQTGKNTGKPAEHGGENFDTSDRGGTLSGALLGCHNATAGDPTNNPCTVQIYINSGSGLTKVVDNDGNSDPLAAKNQEPTSDVSTVAATHFQENASWVSAPNFTGTGYTLDHGYADNIHGGLCAAAAPGCFPQNDWSPTGATKFLGLGIGPIGNCTLTTFGPNVHPMTDSNGNVVGCYDGGALRITATAPPTCPLTQGFWKNHPDAWPVTKLTIGGITYTEAELITVLQTPPSGGDAVLILGHQLIAAMLNVAAGATPPTAVITAIADAQTLLTGINLLNHTIVKSSSTLGQQMVNDSNVLDAFNNGSFNPGCSG